MATNIINRIDKIRNCLIAPFHVQIEVTEKCKASCSQCYIGHNYARDMDFELYKKYILQLYNIGVKTITLTGGDPVEYPHLISAIKEAKTKNIGVDIISSGIGINDELCKKLKDAEVDEVHISLNGSTKEINDSSRSNFNDSINAIKNLRKQNIYCTACWVLRKDNINDIEKYIELCQEMDVNRIYVLKNKRNHNNVIDSEINYLELLQFITIIKPYYERGYVSIDGCFPEIYEHINNKKMPLIMRRCCGGVTHFDVLVDGSFSPCRKTRINEHSNSIAEYWNGTELLSKKRLNNNIRVCQRGVQ